MSQVPLANRAALQGLRLMLYLPELDFHVSLSVSGGFDSSLIPLYLSRNESKEGWQGEGKVGE